MQSADTLVYLHTDHLGSVSAATDSGGSVLSRQEFDPWGAVRSGNSQTSVNFTGRRLDGTGRNQKAIRQNLHNSLPYGIIHAVRGRSSADRALGCGPKGRRFESYRPRQADLSYHSRSAFFLERSPSPVYGARLENE